MEPMTSFYVVDTTYVPKPGYGNIHLGFEVKTGSGKNHLKILKEALELKYPAPRYTVEYQTPEKSGWGNPSNGW